MYKIVYLTTCEIATTHFVASNSRKRMSLHFCLSLTKLAYTWHIRKGRGYFFDCVLPICLKMIIVDVFLSPFPQKMTVEQGKRHCGKSTLLSTITLLRPMGGSSPSDGKAIRSNQRKRYPMGTDLPQSPLLPFMNWYHVGVFHTSMEQYELA